MSGGEPFALLPDNPGEILRIYREMPAGARGAEAPASEDRAMRLALAAADAAIGLGLVYGAGGAFGIDGGVNFVALGAYVVAGNVLANLPLRRGKGQVVLGLLSGNIRLGDNLRAAAQAEGEAADPYSLDVVEPVARHLAGSVLQKAREFEGALARGDDAALARLRARVRELDAELAAETEAAWREAILGRRERLAREIAGMESAAAARRRVRERVREEADALAAGLARLAARRRLLAEIAGDRRERTIEDGPGVESGRTDGKADGAGEATMIRGRLAALTTSLRECDALAAARLSAEREMERWERGG